jgi:polysaccharide export outer membrane protein
MQVFWIAIFLFLAGCTPPVYQNTTYDIEEFVVDSNQIAQGKHSLLVLEGQENNRFVPTLCDSYEEIMMEGDELNIALHCPTRPDRVIALESINATTGFRVCNGHICVPLLSSIQVEGLTLKEVQQKVQMAFGEQLQEPIQIFVNFKKKYERQVQVIGADKPMITVNGQTRLSEVLAKAQIPPDANLFKS